MAPVLCTWEHIFCCCSAPELMWKCLGWSRCVSWAVRRDARPPFTFGCTRFQSRSQTRFQRNTNGVEPPSPYTLFQRSCRSDSGCLISGRRNIWLTYFHSWFLKDYQITSEDHSYLKHFLEGKGSWLITSSSLDIWNYKESMCRNMANIAF